MTQFQTIITGHGHFATGMKGAVELLAGVQTSFKYIDFAEGMSDEELGHQLQAALTSSPTLIFTDLVGGTPYKEAAKLSLSRQDLAVVAGCNLASLLETIFSNYDSLSEYADTLVNVTKQSAQVLDLSLGESEEDPEDGEGI
ncbi:PTS sugar transporter [Lacticaseibacillus camelliae]|nr:PTS sugar transporter [Lacticaseibacillus camelliae]